jgi:hypothetical protein
VGTRVRIAERIYLEDFRRSWKFHHKLSEAQLEYADKVTTVAEVGFYHGGDPVYGLAGMPGLWLEQCLRAEA